MSQACSAAELEQVGTFSSNNAALAVLPIPQYAPFAPAAGQWTLVLDNVNDPGNLGSIIRVADWYGIRHMLCSSDTVDAFNPKVIASAKGSFLRVKLHYGELEPWLRHATQPVYGAFLDGESVHQLTLPPAGGLIVLGNEANGISPAVTAHVSRRITIPAFGQAESLNVGIASAVIVDNLMRLSGAARVN
jgi:TrmH family RNA methyltransferase